ncbi:MULTISPECIES: hypothetical protein [unclassified Streptomyces]|uniref:hypothetical protein n=1 Tax=unclassified Streptomyces TaxID=2593676 RepID=UPI00035EE32B|nr:hypothetical protein [Streptomyces sp. BoleA5]MYX36727.1 hypothetical protein [Streptomyces sp. SID8377]
MTARARLRWNGPAVLAELRTAEVRGVQLAAEHVLERSRARVPIEEGTLERSGVVSVDEDDVTAAVSYDQPYAVRQHEDLTLRHDQGRTAKYLEGPLLEEADQVQAIIAAQVRRALR